MCSLLAMYCTTAGSMLPERVPMMTPSRGVMPMLVSTHLPPSTAAMELPLPRWQVMTRVFLRSRPKNSHTRLLT